MRGAFFRANVGACVTDGQGRVLALRRRGVKRAAWQMPQGGIEAHETPRTALLRELREETGLRARDVTVLAEFADWLVYELPPEYRRPKVGRGQAQKWFLLRAKSGAVVVPDGKEFDAFDWLMPAQLLARVVAFRRPVYKKLFALWPRMQRTAALASLIATLHR
jgi:putative (di)nucleoside polyphosphate hydrolase